jgi:hypothetical protein
MLQVINHRPYRFLMALGIKRAIFCHRAEAYFCARFDGGVLAQAAAPMIRATLTEADPLPGYVGELIGEMGELFAEGGELAVVGSSKARGPFLIFGRCDEVVGELRANFVAAFSAACSKGSAEERYEAARHLRALQTRPVLRVA